MKKMIAFMLSLVMLVSMAVMPAVADETVAYRTLYSGEITSLNYLTTATANEFALPANVIDTLVEYNKYGEVQPSLALSWEYDAENLTYTFKLRENATWVKADGSYYADVTAEDFYRAVNKAQPSLIRTEADELTYCFHVMIRYEIEKQLIGGTLEVKDVPAVWNALYKEYLGVDVPDDKQGCLQDSHWSGGSFGYFPSYALGSAYGAQMLRNMEQDIDVWGSVSKGDLAPVTAWLKEKVHKYGCLLEPGDIVKQACGEFDPTVYTDYLEDKFRRLYNLK